MGVDEVLNFVLEKLKQALLAVENWGGEALAWFDGVFPPDTRRDTIYHWFHVALPFLVAAVVLTAVICCCPCLCSCFCRCLSGCCRCLSRCCCSLCSCCWRCLSGCCRCLSRCCRGLYRCCCLCLSRCYRCLSRCCCGRGRGRMMKAPGRNLRMPRSLFENDPKGYFSNLRAHPGDQLC